MTITYDGTNYGGWQIQPNTVSIQSLLEKALGSLLKMETPITGSGRTDAGVHALGQVAHFFTEKNQDLYKIGHALNGMLPKDIRILEIVEAPLHFHARYTATGKIYHYHLHLDKILNPFTRLYSWKVPHKVDLLTLKKASSLFLGTNDFTSFANEGHKGAAAKNGVRTLQRLDIVPEDGGVRLEFEGDGFLYKMVRNITGTILDVAAGHIAIEEIPNIFQHKDRKKAGKTAPPHGLFLVKVHYEDRSISLKEEN